MVEIGQQNSLLTRRVQLSLPPPSSSSSSSIRISTLKNNQQNVFNIRPLTYIYLKSTIDGVDTEDSKYKVVGINERVWLLVIRYKHLDLTRSIHLSSLNPVSDGYEVNEVPIYEKQPPLSWSFAPLPVVILLHSYACRIYKRVQMVSERPKMNRYTHSKTAKFYHERSTQTREGHENSETEESDFGPCLIGIDPRSSPVTLPSRYRAAASNIQQKPIVVVSSEESEEQPQPQRRQQLNTGLGRTNIVNTVDATATVLHTKVVLYISYA